MGIDQIGAEAMKLSVRERALLAESLWESIGDPFRDTNFPDRSEEEAIALAIERDEEIESGEVKPISHSDLMARLRS